MTPPKSAPTFDKGKSSAKGKGKTSDDAAKGKSKAKATRTARRARRRARATAKAKARSERGLRRMLKVVSGISNRGLSPVCFHSAKGVRIFVFGTSFALQSRVLRECSYLYEVSSRLAQEPEEITNF